MPDLEMLLRDVRPVPDPAWSARLDARVAKRFPGPPPRWQVPLIAMRDHMLAIGAVATVASLFIVVVIAGVSYDGGSDDAATSGAAMPSSMSEESTSSDSSGGGGAAVPKSASGSSGTRNATTFPSTAAAPAQDRDVKSTASLTLSTTPDDVQSVSDRAIRVVDSLDGFVKSSEIDSTSSRAGALLSLRIPSARLDDGLARLSKLAPVKARSQQSEDLTDQRAALEAAVRDARADRDGLRARLAKAATDKERSQLRAKLDLATRRVTRRERDVAALGQEVAYATVDLTIEGRKRSGAAAAPGDRWTPGDAVADAGRVLEVIAGVLVIALAILLPIAAIALLARVAGRLVTRRRRERALEMA